MNKRLQPIPEDEPEAARREWRYRAERVILVFRLPLPAMAWSVVSISFVPPGT